MAGEVGGIEYLNMIMASAWWPRVPPVTLPVTPKFPTRTDAERKRGALFAPPLH